jgi:hypothetical protein
VSAMTSSDDTTRDQTSSDADEPSPPGEGRDDDSDPGGRSNPASQRTPNPGHDGTGVDPLESRPGPVARLLRNQRPALREFQENINIVSEIRDAHPWLASLLGRLWRRLSSAIGIIVTVLFAIPTIGDVRTSTEPVSGETATALAGNWQTYLFILVILPMLMRRFRR